MPPWSGRPDASKSRPQFRVEKPAEMLIWDKIPVSTEEHVRIAGIGWRQRKNRLKLQEATSQRLLATAKNSRATLACGTVHQRADEGRHHHAGQLCSTSSPLTAGDSARGATVSSRHIDRGLNVTIIARHGGDGEVRFSQAARQRTRRPEKLASLTISPLSSSLPRRRHQPASAPVFLTVGGRPPDEVH